MFDEANKVLACRWQDKEEVTLLTNHDHVYPLHMTSRRQKPTETMPAQTQVRQPLLIKHYNAVMGGLDLHDNAVSNYRVAIRSKKWYWPLWLRTFESAVVNAWKLQCMIAKSIGKRIPHQKDFRESIMIDLLLTPDEEDPPVISQEEGDEYAYPTFVPPLPRRNANHISVNHPDKKPRRCKVCHLHSNVCFARHHGMKE